MKSDGEGFLVLTVLLTSILVSVPPVLTVFAVILATFLTAISVLLPHGVCIKRSTGKSEEGYEADIFKCLVHRFDWFIGLIDWKSSYLLCLWFLPFLPFL